MAWKKEVSINFGDYGEMKVIMETEDVETKIKFESQNKDGTMLVIAEKDQEDFVHDLQQVFMRYFI